MARGRTHAVVRRHARGRDAAVDPPGGAPTRHLAIDWSGAKSGSASKIWLAEARTQAGAPRLTRLESGRTRTEVIDHL
ncbi:MAG TPA: hypothetical protein VLA09_13375, partial [Longimicrobiales bacterium]|nr:hypothetical protein [Longimicrobiales bacterium]